MHFDKSPTLDGYNPTFYKRFWDLISDDIFLNGVAWMNQGILTPKVE